jgi:D-glycero-D-manno-heptose 1,7-bisphosphate phosphatase
VSGPKAVFLDRDGTVSLEMGYIHEKDLPAYALIPGAAEGMKRLQDAGYKLILVTNQSGVARGYYPESTVHAVHAKLEHLLSKQGVRLNGIYFCPHHPDPSGPTDTGDSEAAGSLPAKPVAALAIDCGCRKPKPGMGLQAAREHGLDLSQSWMVGDKGADLGFAKNLGVRAVLVKTGHGAASLKKLEAKGQAPALVAQDLAGAAGIILKNA